MQILEDFSVADLDNDGVISQSEVRKLLRDLGIQFTERLFKAHFRVYNWIFLFLFIIIFLKAVDIDGNDRLDVNEFTQFMKNIRRRQDVTRKKERKKIVYLAFDFLFFAC